MGSGESDIRYIKIDTSNTVTTTGSIVKDSYYIDSGTSNWNYNWWTYPTVIYKYQVRCPKRGCKTFNLLELDTTTPCTNCGSKLRAVADIPDFTIPVK